MHLSKHKRSSSYIRTTDIHVQEVLRFILWVLFHTDYTPVSQNSQVTVNFNKKFGDFNTRAKLSYLFEISNWTSNSTTGNDFGLAGIPSLDAIAGNISFTSYKRR